MRRGKEFKKHVFIGVYFMLGDLKKTCVIILLMFLAGALNISNAYSQENKARLSDPETTERIPK